MTAPSTVEWDLQVRPHRMRQFAWGAAILIVIGHVAVALLLTIKASGVIFRASDQVAMVLLGLIAAGGVLLFTRPRLRVGPAGVAVRNVLGERLIPWPAVVGVSFPAGKRWARLELPADEYLPVVAIQSIDRERAVEAMRTVRQLLARYRPDDEGVSPGDDD
ncbi:PH domain-containing protein [Mycobacterium sp. M1]|uniref:PH domain-containing protein n=1 Tax=Mycolicibacter acidiphilus TaxID=2835306 RepID=A0ABS5RD50_9MYCO|nr:PH domain-containing protein [Mycolicibacter acidiphilus]MBS9532213.1 PH domain-containing protein [Mycolicibacter acidiphilus]